MRTSGDDTFDRILGGGVPEGGTLLLVGDPWAGTGRLATTVLRGEGPGLYLTTERHATGAPTAPGVSGGGLPDDVEGATFEWVDEELVVHRLARGTRTNLTAVPESDPVPGRVVVDGVDALVGMCGGWSPVVSLLSRLEDTGATCVVTATDPDESLLRHAAVVVEAWQESVGGDYQPYCRVRQHRTAPHDSRKHRLALTAEGAAVVARERAASVPRLATDIEAFDDLTGGGFARGGTTVFEHDGSADHWPFTAAVCAHVIERDATVVCITAPGIVTARMNDFVEPRVGDVGSLMDDDSLYVVDTVSQTPETPARSSLPPENVIVQAEVGSIQEAIRSLVADLSGQAVLAVLEVTPLLHLVEDDQARQLFYWASANVLAMEGLSLVLAVDREVAGDRLTSFFTGSAEQVFRTWQADDGIQYLSVEKSPDGSPGHTRAIEPLSDPPFVRLR